MTTATDTLRIAKHLKSLDFTERQAEGLAEVVRQIDVANRDDVVTREFFRAELKAELKSLETRLITWMIGSVATIAGLMIATKIFA